MKKNFRIIPRLEIKTKFLVKGMRMDGLKKIGDPSHFSKNYFEEMADEIFYDDIVASLYNRKIDINLIKDISSAIQIPLTVSGKIKNINDIYKIFRSGGDKVSINTYALKKPEFLSDATKVFGSQSICVHMQFKKIGEYTYEVFSESGRERNRTNLLDWVKETQDRGVGEIYLFSIDNDGVSEEIDYSILEKVRKICKVPLLYGGGVRSQNIINKIIDIELDGACISYALHNKKISIPEIKKNLKNPIRRYINS